ncbi:MAG: hypothetical protein H6765_11240 [Candidatus Peribacteria bacterium]|nr:MAG: hypothetical protein H6765_11240 [Candidatus Peribacteria bacterium]
MLNHKQVNFVPQILSNNVDSFSYRWITAEHFASVWKKADTHEKLSLAQQLLDKAYILDQLGIVHGELIRPTKNVLVDNTGKIWIIDFERGRFGDKSGKNMRSLSQRLLSQNYLSLDQCVYLGTLSPAKMYMFLCSQLSTPSEK